MQGFLAIVNLSKDAFSFCLFSWYSSLRISVRFKAVERICCWSGSETAKIQILRKPSTTLGSLYLGFDLQFHFRIHR